MRQPLLAVGKVMLWACPAMWAFGCAPGANLEPFASKGKTSSASIQPLGNDAIPISGDQEGVRTPPPDDPLEEEKAIEPAVIGGAYLYCDSEESKGPNPQSLNVGCRLGNAASGEWDAAEKNLFVMNSLDGMMAPITVSIQPQSSAYHMSFSMDRSLLNLVELHADLMLPQGRLLMSTTVNPGALKAVEQRLGEGLALYASTGAAGDWPGVDRKTWNLWMPLEIPRYLTNFSGSSNSGPGGPSDRMASQMELVFDDTVCIYENRSADLKNEELKDAKPEDFVFKSCSRNWLPTQWVRVKSLTLRVPEADRKGSKAVGVVLKTAP